MAGTDRREATGAIALAVAVLVGSVVAIVERTGRLGYAIDDAYIHLAIAGNLADHGTFGIEPGHFESASSSPLWTVLLAAGRATAIPATWLPLLLAAPFGVLATWLLARSASEEGSNHRYERLAVVLLPVTLGVAPLVMTGMEHAAHVVAVLLLLRLATDPSRGAPWHRPALLVVATTLRFETAFVAAGLCCLTVLRGGDRRAMTRRVLADAAPVAGVLGLVAVVNLSFGQHLLPNSVVAKAATARPASPAIFGDALGRLLEDPLLLGLLVATAVVAVQRRPRAPTRDAAIVVLVAATAHVLLADVGWFARYQAYLVAGGLYVCLTALRQLQRSPRRSVLAVALVVAVAPRTALLLQTPRAANDIHRDQEQVGRFLVEERPGEAVALNDIGFPAFLGAGPIIDVYGLADHELLDLRRAGDLDPETTEAVLREDGAELMILFEGAFGAIVPDGWRAVERWCFPAPYVLAEGCITFFAAPGAAREVRSQLDRFADRLPDDVVRQPDTSTGDEIG